MRRRLLLSAVAVIAATLLAFALPLGLVARNLLTTRALDTLESGAQQVAGFADEQARTCGELELILTVAARGEPVRLALFSRGGELVGAVGSQPPTAGPELATAVRGGVGRSYVAGRLAVAVPLSTGACGQRLILHAERPDDALRASVRGAWLSIGAVGAAVLALAALAAVLLGRALARPFEALAESARRLGDGDFTARAPRAGLPEADAIADALDATADRLGRAVQRGRAFTADASHQLRTPMTALRLQLDALEAGGADADSVRAAEVEVDRLDATIDELVALTRVETTDQATDLSTLVRERLAAWETLAAEQGRHVTVEAVPAPSVRVRPAAVAQALQVLVDNALDHGRGAITVRVAPTVPDQPAGGGVRVCVVDEGPGLPDDALDPPAGRDRGGGPLPVRGGRGLKLARSLVEGEGGRLVTDPEAPTTTICLLLPQN